MNKNLIKLLVAIAWVPPRVSFASCTYVKDEGQFAMKKDTNSVEYNFPESEHEWVIPFVDANGSQRKAEVRLSVDDEKDLLLLYDGAGRVAQIPLDNMGPLRETRAVRLHPSYDSIFIENAERHNGPGSDILRIIDPTTCDEIAGVTYFDGYSFATFDNLSDPKYAAEKSFFEQIAVKERDPTKGIVAREASDPKWSHYVWELNNGPMDARGQQGTFKLHWYPWDKNICLGVNQGAFVYKQYRIPPMSNVSIEICDTATRQWATLYLFDGYKEFPSDLEVHGSTVTLLLREAPVGINLDNFSWWYPEGHDYRIKSKLQNSLPIYFGDLYALTPIPLSADDLTFLVTILGQKEQPAGARWQALLRLVMDDRLVSLNILDELPPQQREVYFGYNLDLESIFRYATPEQRHRLEPLTLMHKDYDAFIKRYGSCADGKRHLRLIHGVYERVCSSETAQEPTTFASDEQSHYVLPAFCASPGQMETADSPDQCCTLDGVHYAKVCLPGYRRITNKEPNYCEPI